MMRISEEQKVLLAGYEGGRTKIIRDMKLSAEELRSSEQDEEMSEILEDLISKLESCSNKEYFQMKKERLLDTEVEESEILEGGIDD